jgi:hypothetical protein
MQTGRPSPMAAALESQKAKLADTLERGKSGWRSAKAGIAKLRAAGTEPA